MTIYIELFLIQNILINFCLLKLIKITTKSKTNTFRLLLASSVGAIPSIIIIYFLNNNVIINIMKLATSFLIMSIGFTCSKKQFLFNYILLFIYTYAFGGIISSLSSSVYYTSFGTVTTSKYSIEFICLIFIIFTYVFELIAKNIKFKMCTNNLIYNVTLNQSNKSIKINAYLDTGNFINHNGKPVLILDLEVFLKLTNTNLINFYTTKTETINVGTVSGYNNLKIFSIDKITIQNGKEIKELKNQIVAINLNNNFKNTNYQALLSPLFL